MLPQWVHGLAGGAEPFLQVPLAATWASVLRLSVAPGLHLVFRCFGLPLKLYVRRWFRPSRVCCGFVYVFCRSIASYKKKKEEETALKLNYVLKGEKNVAQSAKLAFDSRGRNCHPVIKPKNVICSI